MLPALSPPPSTAVRAERMLAVETVPFALAHLACFAAIATGIHLTDLLIAVALYALRMFAITAGYHRYFAHRSFKTSRVFGFLLAFLAQSSAQRGVLWWAGKHRHHHRYSDTDEDVHSPGRCGFWHAHMGWFFAAQHRRTDLDAIRDFAQFPELRWLDRLPYLPPVLLALAVFATAGWSGLIVGFFWSTVALWHATFSINSLAHVIGRQRYVTGDRSRNNWWLALLTFGEGWHNNHHHYQSAARQGFRWYEIDFSYYALRALALMGLVWDLQTPPQRVVRNEQRLRRAVIEKAARELALSFKPDEIAAELRAFFEKGQMRLDQKAESLRAELTTRLEKIDLSAMPSLADFRDRATAMFARTPSLNDIAERARQMVIETLCEELLVRQAVRRPQSL